MNFTSGKFYKVALLLAAAALLVMSSLCQRALNRQRADPALGLTRVTPLENAPPVLAFTTVALGGFRGLIANALWSRAMDLQEQDKYFEKVQLADWITKLEPHFTQVWLVQAWDMAYNISVKFSDHADRWRWVQRGIELLRDEGLRYNPGEALMYRELAWFFQHKMGQSLDDAHNYYKMAWAGEMTRALGNSLTNLAELLNPQSDELRQRAERLREKFKLNPAIMLEVDRLYGPLDWRLPETHAMYWAVAGLAVVRKTDAESQKEITALRRVIYQSMHAAVLRGRIISQRADGSVRIGPNLDLVAKTNEAYERMMRDDQEEAFKILAGHRNFLREAVYLLYTNNRKAEAGRRFQQLKEQYPEWISPPGLTLDEFVIQRVMAAVVDLNPNRIIPLIGGYLENGLIQQALGEDENAANYTQMANTLWVRYQESIRRQEKRIGLPPLAEMRQIVLEGLLDAQRGLKPELALRLRQLEGLPAPTNAPPGLVPEPKAQKP